jgi:hypothetical protein
MNSSAVPSVHLTQITPQQSLHRGIKDSLLIGVPVGVLFAGAVWWISPFASAIALVVTGGLAARAILYKGYEPKEGHVEYGHTAIPVGIGDHPTGEGELTSGDHYRRPGLEGAIPVDRREIRIDPAKFLELAGGDNLSVQVDGYFYKQVFYPELAIMVKDADGSLKKEFQAQVRFFVNQLGKAEYSIDVKDELADWLHLPPYNGSFDDQYLQVWLELDANADKFVDGRRSVDALMNKAGKFVGQAFEWGIRIPEVHIEYFDIPESRKAAALQAANQPDEMKAKKEQNRARVNMVKGLTKAGVDPNAALASADMTLGLPVKRNIEEHSIGFKNFDAGKAVDSVLKPLAEAIAERIKAGGNTTPPSTP